MTSALRLLRWERRGEAGSRWCRPILFSNVILILDSSSGSHTTWEEPDFIFEKNKDFKSIVNGL